MTFSDITSPTNLVSRPSRNADGYKDLSSWAEEQIWGHRLWHRQTPWLLFLEFLGVAEAMLRAGRLFSVDWTKPIFTYNVHRRIGLRNLIFNNASVLRVNESAKTDTIKWDDWIAWMNEECEPNRGIDFSYLRQRFTRFSDFARAVELLRQTAIDPTSNRRWSSRFLFPFGPESLYEDVNIKGGKDSREMGNFGRTGDLLYMMLSRSCLADDLKNSFSTLLGAPTVPGKMVAKLLPPPPADDSLYERTSGYLPYRKHPAYDRLAEDWMALLRLGLPARDAYGHLVPLGAFHVLLYQMETAAAWAGTCSRPCTSARSLRRRWSSSGSGPSAASWTTTACRALRWRHSRLRP